MCIISQNREFYFFYGIIKTKWGKFCSQISIIALFILANVLLLRILWTIWMIIAFMYFECTKMSIQYIFLWLWSLIQLKYYLSETVFESRFLCSVYLMNAVIYGRGNSACFKKGYKFVTINTILSLCMLIMDRHRHKLIMKERD